MTEQISCGIRHLEIDERTVAIKSYVFRSEAIHVLGSCRLSYEPSIAACLWQNVPKRMDIRQWASPIHRKTSTTFLTAVSRPFEPMTEGCLPVSSVGQPKRGMNDRVRERYQTKQVRGRNDIFHRDVRLLDVEPQPVVSIGTEATWAFLGLGCRVGEANCKHGSSAASAICGALMTDMRMHKELAAPQNPRSRTRSRGGGKPIEA